MLGLYREVYRSWNVNYFYEYLRRDHGFRSGSTWAKTQHCTRRGLVECAKGRGAHRRKRERKPCQHRDGSQAARLCGQPALDLTVTIDDDRTT
jgi:hypothetical protein